MSNVVPIPVKKRFPRSVKSKEVWAQERPPDEMVWEICPYIRNNLDKCCHCPHSYEDPTYGPMSDGCYVLAAESCRIVFAMQKRLNNV